MFCISCGSDMPPSMKFCGSCGEARAERASTTDNTDPTAAEKTKSSGLGCKLLLIQVILVTWFLGHYVLKVW